MTATTLLVQCLLAVASIATAFKHGVPSNDPTLFVPNSYIVEVDGTAASLSKRGLSAFKVRQTPLSGPPVVFGSPCLSDVFFLCGDR